MPAAAFGRSFPFWPWAWPWRRCFSGRRQRRIALVAAAVPIALFVNVLRIVVTGLLTHYVGPEAALGFFHEFEGMVVFAVALVMLFGTNLVLDRMGGKAELKIEN